MAFSITKKFVSRPDNKGLKKVLLKQGNKYIVTYSIVGSRTTWLEDEARFLREISCDVSKSTDLFFFEVYMHNQIQGFIRR